MEAERLFKDQADAVLLGERLRDVYLIYKELSSRHSVSMETSLQERVHKLVYFSKPESVFCQNPDLQVKFRQEVLAKAAEVPMPRPVPLYPDTLLSEYKQAQTKNTPPNVRT